MEIPRMATSDNISLINGALNTASNSLSINSNIGGWRNTLNDITTIGTDMSYYDNSGYTYRQAPDGDLIEFKLTDGTKIIKEIIWGRIENIAEKINAEKNNQKYVILDYKEKDGRVKTYEIDCNLSMFMKLIGKEYKSWNQMMMTESVKNGNKVN
jgi:hypothetical protein